MPKTVHPGYIDAVRRTTLDIDEDMLSKAREILGTRGVKDTVDEALREVVRMEAGRRFIARLKDNEDFGPETRERAWPTPPIS
ncbi:MAG TPA: type II toxin-antitoxin system VapB family antitoxin [Solirubrobacteraceae bacterium]|jgi:Arc/MetJ family transcription regulator|nr:type II toxin-antitoxin system VapB family antitoxin [Solirubrobacteraceae bacterium]